MRAAPGPMGFETIKVGLLRLQDTKDALRIASFVDQLMPWFEMHKPNLVAFEGYGGMKFANHAILAAELGGAARLLCAAFRVPYFAVPPSTLKNWVCGQWTKAQGSPTKERMCVQVAARWKYEAMQSDDADAFAAAVLGIHILNRTLAATHVGRKIIDRYGEEIVRSHLAYEGRLSCHRV